MIVFALFESKRKNVYECISIFNIKSMVAPRDEIIRILVSDWKHGWEWTRSGDQTGHNQTLWIAKPLWDTQKGDQYWLLLRKWFPAFLSVPWFKFVTTAACVCSRSHLLCKCVFSDYCEVLAQWAELVINRYEHLMSLATCEQHERYVGAQTCSLQSAATEICHSQVTFIFHSQGCCKMWLLELLLLMEATEKSKLCTSHFSLKKVLPERKKIWPSGNFVPEPQIIVFCIQFLPSWVV